MSRVIGGEAKIGILGRSSGKLYIKGMLNGELGTDVPKGYLRDVMNNLHEDIKVLKEA